MNRRKFWRSARIGHEWSYWSSKSARGEGTAGICCYLQELELAVQISVCAISILCSYSCFSKYVLKFLRSGQKDLIDHWLVTSESGCYIFTLSSWCLSKFNIWSLVVHNNRFSLWDSKYSIGIFVRLVFRFIFSKKCQCFVLSAGTILLLIETWEQYILSVCSDGSSRKCLWLWSTLHLHYNHYIPNCWLHSFNATHFTLHTVFVCK